MSKYSKIGKLAKCGSHDSKYMSRPNGLDEDAQNKKLEHEACKQAIRDIILSDPSKMDLRYNDAIEALIEIKEECRL